MKPPQPYVYPEKFQRTVKLRDEKGTRVLLRPIKPEDASMWVELYNSLSSISKYYRFFSTHREPTQKMINEYTNVDYINNFALVAIMKENEEDKMVGVARYVLDPPPDSAELAIVVRDDVQGKGLGTQLLLFILEIMVKRKIKKVHGDVFLENRKMLQLMHESGFRLRKENSFGVRHFEFNLSGES
ncbi:MAG: GNAT family N-acetyltransferase [Candidatus Helarchaeota archaeon]